MILLQSVVDRKEMALNGRLICIQRTHAGAIYTTNDELELHITWRSRFLYNSYVQISVVKILTQYQYSVQISITNNCQMQA